MKKNTLSLRSNHRVKLLTWAVSVAAALVAPTPAWSGPILQHDSYVSTELPGNTLVLPDKHGSEPKIVLNKSNTGYIAFSLKNALPEDLASTGEV